MLGHKGSQLQQIVGVPLHLPELIRSQENTENRHGKTEQTYVKNQIVCHFRAPIRTSNLK